MSVMKVTEIPRGHVIEGAIFGLWSGFIVMKIGILGLLFACPALAFGTGMLVYDLEQDRFSTSSMAFIATLVGMFLWW